MSTNNNTTTFTKNPTFDQQVAGAKKHLVAIVEKYAIAYVCSLPANEVGHRNQLLDAMEYAAGLHAAGKQTDFHFLWENWKRDSRKLSMQAYVEACIQLGIKVKVDPATAKVAHLYRGTLGLETEIPQASLALAMDATRGMHLAEGQIAILAQFYAGWKKAEDIYSPVLRRILGLDSPILV